jgi:hypothetical protein
MKSNFILDLQDEMQNLYWGSESFVSPHEIQLRRGRVKFNEETGMELEADLILTPELTNVSCISPRMENKIVEDREDSLCNAALFIYEDDNGLEPDFGELEYEFTDEPNGFITPAQQSLNFNFYMERLAKAKNFRELKVVRESVLTGQKGSWFFMSRPNAKTFWNAYDAKKEKMNAYKRSA